MNPKLQVCEKIRGSSAGCRIALKPLQLLAFTVILIIRDSILDIILDSILYNILNSILDDIFDSIF